MSETQVNQPSPISGAPKPAPVPTPPATSAMPNLTATSGPKSNISAASPESVSSNAVPLSTSTPQSSQSKPPANINTLNNINSNLIFDSSKNIPKSAQKTDHFAEQNQRRIAKKEENKKRSKRAAIILAALIGIVSLSLVIWLIILLIPKPDNTFIEPEILPTNMEELKNEADKIYKDTGSLDSADQIFQNTINTIENTTSGSTQQAHINQVYWTQFLFYAENLENEKIIELAPEVNPDLLDDYQKISYYNILYQVSYAMGDTEAQERYYNLFTEISEKIYGEIGE